MIVLTLQFSFMRHRMRLFTLFIFWDQSPESFPHSWIFSADRSSSSAHLTDFPVHISDAGPPIIYSYTPLRMIHSVEEGFTPLQMHFFDIVDMMSKPCAAVGDERASHFPPALYIEVLRHMVDYKPRVKVWDVAENSSLSVLDNTFQKFSCV